jgi:hypothetical protein
MKRYRFFYHYHKRYNEMSVHFRGKCMRAKNVYCSVPCETRWNKTQPHLTMRGYAHEAELRDDLDTIFIR